MPIKRLRVSSNSEALAQLFQKKKKKEKGKKSLFLSSTFCKICTPNCHV